MSASLRDFLRSVKQVGGSAVVDVQGDAHQVFDDTGRTLSSGSLTAAGAAELASLPDVSAELAALRAKFTAAGLAVTIAMHVTPPAATAATAATTVAATTTVTPATTAAPAASTAAASAPATAPAAATPAKS